MGYFEEGKWWVSLYNFEPEVVKSLGIPKRVEIHDATLRDGEQTPGVVFRPDDKVRIAEKLAEVGIERIEAGMPAVSEDDFIAIKRITSLKLPSKIFTFARATNEDMDKALECGADGVVIEIPIGYPKLKYQFNWTWETVLEKSAGCIEYAKKNGLYTVYFPYDTTRARPEDLKGLLEGLKKSAIPDSIGLVDTMGCATPEAIRYMVRWMKSILDIPVEIHTHNDFGMAVATELAAMTAGAEVVHSCINGLGERTGNAAVEELIVAMNLLYGVDNPYKLGKLPELCELARELSGVEYAANKPVVGSRNYTRESGIGVDLVMKEPLAMFATAPQLTGRNGDVVLGKKSGKTSVEYTLSRMGIAGCSDDQVAEMLKQVKAIGIEKRRLLTDEEFRDVVKRVAGK